MLRWAKDFEPHDTHDMTKPRTLTRTPANTSRLYSVRTCKYCGLETGVSVAGEYYEPGLEIQCEGAE